jgi:hypothetical protein
MNTNPQTEREVYQTVPSKSRVQFTDELNNIISELTAVSDFIKRIGDDSYLLENDTPYGLHLIMGQCISNLKTISVGGSHETN